MIDAQQTSLLPASSDTLALLADTPPNTLLSMFNAGDLDGCFARAGWSADADVQVLVEIARSDLCEPAERMKACELLRKRARDALLLSGELASVTGRVTQNSDGTTTRDVRVDVRRLARDASEKASETMRLLVQASQTGVPVAFVSHKETSHGPSQVEQTDADTRPAAAEGEEGRQVGDILETPPS